MNKTKKVLIILSVMAVMAGLIISLSGLAALKFDFTKLDTQKYETNTYEIDENFDNVNINVRSNDIYFKQSENGKCKVNCYDEEDVTFSVNVIDNTLTITNTSETKFRNFYFGINVTSPKITVYLPEKNYGKLYIKSSSGDTSIPEGFYFTSAEIYSSSGDTAYYAETAEDLTIKSSSGDLMIGSADPQNINVRTSSGEIDMLSLNIKSDLNVKSTSGDISLSHVASSNIFAECTSGDMAFKDVTSSENINAKTTSGDIYLDNSDGKDLYISSTSGDVAGFLRTEKTFVTDTNSGDVNIPHNNNGSPSGICEITTSSGDISMTVKD